jgi:hypothetical protein
LVHEATTANAETPTRDSAPPATVDTTSAPVVTASLSPATNTTALAATLSDARSVAREFLSICNQRRWRDLEALDAHGGDAALRVELIRLVRTAPDFAAGFDRLASAPVPGVDGFTTDVVLDLAWRGGQRLVAVHLHVERQAGSWRLAGFTATPGE